MTPFEAYQEKNKLKKREKKLAGKEKRELIKKQSKMTDAEVREKETKRQQLSMLVGDTLDESDMEFKGNNKDSRFTTILKNKDFALDPTHKDFNKKEKKHRSKKW